MVGNKVYIYSTEVAASTDPESLSPSTLIKFTKEPIVDGSIDIDMAPVSRGMVIPTLGGRVIQDLGLSSGEYDITMKGDDALDKTNAQALRTAYEASDTEYYFTEGFNVFKIKFSKERGSFKLKRNLAAGYFDRDVYSYELKMIATAHPVKDL